ncbi:MAG: sigma-70 family RNA polymerase sigma factor [Oscillospiraceae bacterium]|nr:sigma-70 family RNA polymerase sigma factor [Oscillospiraceae bacterium]
MTIEEKLESARFVDREIEALRKAKNQALANTVYLSPTFSEAVQGSKGNSSERKNIAYSSYTEQLDVMSTKLMETKNEALRIIYLLPDPADRVILVEYFINGLKPYQIGPIVNFETSTVKKRIRKALAFLEKTEGTEEK